MSGVAIVQGLQNHGISQRTKVLIDKLLLGGFTLTEIAQVTGIPEQGLKSYLNTNSTFEAQQLLS